MPDLVLGEPAPAHDVAAARAVDEMPSDASFEELIRRRRELLPTSPRLRRRYVAGDSCSGKPDRQRDAVENALGRQLRRGERFLDVGCGTGVLAAAAAARGADVCAGDVSLSALVIARRRLGADAAVAAFAGEALPFGDESFDVVSLMDVIEHVADARATLAECARVLVHGGTLVVATPNRFSLGLEPHVRLPLVGYLPRPLAARYVSALRGVSYESTRLLSARSLKQLLFDAGFDARLIVPEVPPASRELYRGIELALVHSYNRVRRVRAAQPVLELVGPFFEVAARKP